VVSVPEPEDPNADSNDADDDAPPAPKPPPPHPLEVFPLKDSVVIDLNGIPQVFTDL
jgi:hypothetical protein